MISGSTLRSSLMPRRANSGLSLPPAVMKVGATSASWYSMSVSPRWKASQRPCVSSMMLISTPPISGSRLPSRDPRLADQPGGFASSTIFEERV